MRAAVKYTTMYLTAMLFKCIHTDKKNLEIQLEAESISNTIQVTKSSYNDSCYMTAFSEMSAKNYYHVFFFPRSCRPITFCPVTFVYNVHEKYVYCSDVHKATRYKSLYKLNVPV